ncbi:hypothetical protein CVT24_006883 [Panaeolus cyanescens]|uniref:precorrin-2 dehydrogenase n=1 Tax=Panaeolus cyanescens TaxID=181874 RepID=A0A409YWV9_9AGAR|nr:hypothetical protein CVT24_006883 [Panaeolus cyanescens]
MQGTAYSNPTGGASLILSFRLQNKTTLIVGSGTLAASRAFAALEADSAVIILAKGGLQSACEEIRWRHQQNQLQFVNWDELPGSSGPNRDAETLDAFLKETPGIALAVVTDTLNSIHRRNYSSAAQLHAVFKSRNIPVNITDMADLCDFSFAASHRFQHHITGEKTSLQVGVTTNGQGCRLAARLRRDIVSKLPREVGAAVEKVGRMRDMAKDSEDATHLEGVQTVEDAEEEIAEDGVILTPNRPVPSRSPSETAFERRKRRIKWVAQLSEYWPISKLATMSVQEMQDVLAEQNGLSSEVIPTSAALVASSSVSQVTTTASQSPESACQSLNEDKVTGRPPVSQHFFDLPPKPGKILLVGSGPGHPSLLTMATHTALTQLADVVLSDKLVPDAVLALIPKHVRVQIARKFPGNAEGAQAELMEAAVEAANKGLTVVRLKQGDPVVYGRAGEEVLYFRERGFEPLVVPGVSSALAAPTFAGIPITQRGVAESFIVCTGVGRQGKEVQLPGYDRGRTLIVLMGVARLQRVISTLLDPQDEEDNSTGAPGTTTDPEGLPAAGIKTSAKSPRRDGPAYPPHTPIAIIERASMPDQRVIYSTLKDIVRALENSGEQRPPGMMVIGWAVLALGGGDPNGKGDVGVLDDVAAAAAGGDDLDKLDEARISRWLGGDSSVGWRVREGIDPGWEDV